MEELKNRIIKDGEIFGGDILKVDSFLNHQIDVKLLIEIGKEFYNRFKDYNITKILTIEASGISVACAAAMNFHVPVIFAKKGNDKKLVEGTYSSNAFSYTKGESYIMNVSKKYISSEDKILIIDDFMANGEAALAMMDIVNMAGAELVGIGVVIEKAFQRGGKMIREMGIKIESLVSIESMKEGNLIFTD